MKILFDTNIVLDVLLNRQPYSPVAINLFSAVEGSVIQGFLCATTFTTVDYLIAKALGRKAAKSTINGLLTLFSCAEVNQNVLKAAIDTDFPDFEDAVLYQAGVHAKVDGVVTRNIKDFNTAEQPIYSPSELWSIIQTND